MNDVTIGITYWDGLVSPLFDAATTMLIDSAAGRRLAAIEPGLPHGRARWCEREGLELVICGAISTEAQRSLMDRQIDLLPWMSGPVAEIIDSVRKGTLAHHRYAMPGCRWQCRTRGRGRRRGKGCSF